MTQPLTEQKQSDAAVSNWQARPVTLNDEAAMLELYRDSFGRERSGADWRWKLMSQVTATPMNVVAKNEAGQLICHHGGIPFRFSMAGEIVDVVQSVEVMTSPHHRRKGLLMGVGKELYDSWSDAGVAFILGMPNEKWGSRAAAIGFQPFSSLRWMKLVLRPSRALAGTLPGPLTALMRPLDPPVALATRLMARAPKGVSLRLVRSAGDEFDALWRRAAATYSDDYLLVRDPAYVQWRFLDCPVPYSVLLAEDQDGAVGYAAFRVTETEGRKIGWLADLFAPRGEASIWRVLIRAAADAMRREGADSVAALASPDSEMYRRLRQGGFLVGRHSFALSLVPGAWPGCAAAIEQSQRWQLAGANLDVI